MINLNKCAEYIINNLENNGFEAYVVGGCVRDALMNREPHDWDICTNARAEDTFNIFGKLGNIVIATGVRYGTVSVILSEEDIGVGRDTQPQIFEVSTFRKECSSKNPAKVEFTDDIRLDLIRRDFTINSLAYNHRTGIIDVTGGIPDIRNKVIRCFGDPKDRLSEDYIRILRAIRFQAQLGFDIEESTKQSLVELSDKCGNVSTERIQAELLKLINSNYAKRALLRNKDAIRNIIPEFGSMMNTEQNNPHHKYDVYKHSVMALDFIISQGYEDMTLRLAALLHDIGKPATKSTDDNGVDHFYRHSNVGAVMVESLMKRLNFSNSLTKSVVTLVRYHECDFNSKSGMRRMFNKIGPEATRKIMALRHADTIAQSCYEMDSKVKHIQKMNIWFSEIISEDNIFKVADLEISGTDLINLGYKPGPYFRQILDTTLNEVIDGNVSNTKEELVDFITSHFVIGGT